MTKLLSFLPVIWIIASISIHPAYAVEDGDFSGLLKGEKISSPPGIYKSGQDEVTVSLARWLEKLGDFLVENEGMVVEIGGYTDTTGSVDLNKELSLMRAQRAMEYIVEARDIKEYRIKVKGYGPESPIADNQTREGRKRNRRIEIVNLRIMAIAEIERKESPKSIRKRTVVDVDATWFLYPSGYYDQLKDDSIVNPDNLLGRENYGFLIEINNQSKLVFFERHALNMDLSYQYSQGPGRQKKLETHFTLYEFYFDLNYLKFGKKRESWQIGKVFHPIDFINPPMNPLDPSRSREGIYLSMVEIPFSTASLKFVYYPTVEYDPKNMNGIPEKVDFDSRFGVQSYFLVKEIDLAFIYYRYDRVPTLMKNYVGATFNRYFGDTGIDLEILGHKGNDMEFVQQNSAGDYYFLNEEQRLAQAKEDDDIYVNFTTGVNYTFSDSTKITLEYLRNSEGHTSEQLKDLHGFFDQYSSLYLQSHDDDIKNLLLKGTDLLQNRIGRNYIGFSFDRPNTWTDFYPRLNFVLNMDDKSCAISGMIDYLVSENMTLSMLGYNLVGDEETEYGLKPDRRLITLEMKYFW
ncbi:OmpA family protein [Acidobacteriota bacterium]